MEKMYAISCPSCCHKMEAGKSIAQKEGIFPLGWARCTRCNSGMRLVYDDVADAMRVEPAELEGGIAVQGYNPQKASQQYQNAQNNAQGHIFEDYIKAACLMYRDSGRAEIDKTPEAFRVLQKFADGIFKGQFTARAQPDFQGTLSGGRSIVFETKFTRTERMRREALTDYQMKLLQNHHTMGALAAVCCGIVDRFYFVPWPVWEAMKAHFGRLYVTAEDLEPYRVRFTGNIMFLDYIHPEIRREKGGFTGYDDWDNSNASLLGGTHDSHGI